MMPDREKVMSWLEGLSEPDWRDFHSDSEVQNIAKSALALLKEQEKPNGKCVNECECWDSAYERGKQDSPKEQEAVVRCKDCKHYRINTVYPGTNMIMKYCAKTGIAESNPDWFCADGERNDGERGEKYDRGYREV